jgi:hypothetical protein
MLQQAHVTDFHFGCSGTRDHIERIILPRRRISVNVGVLIADSLVSKTAL